ncbi:MAG: acid phosphatase [Flavobacteriaceae bacterium]
MKKLAFLGVSLLILASCKQNTTQTIEYKHQIDTLASGYLKGYLTDTLNISAVLNAPPSLGSDLFSIDSIETMKFYQSDESRKQQAVADAKLSFESFEEISGMQLSMETTPHAYILMQRVIGDVISYSGQAKKEFKRLRPYETLGIESCWPEKEHKGSYSYPSGHAMIGFTWAALFSSIYSEQGQELMARGEAYANSRVVCGVHWYYDVVASKSLSSTLISNLLKNEEFQHDLDAAQLEIERLKIR